MIRKYGDNRNPTVATKRSTGTIRFELSLPASTALKPVALRSVDHAEIRMKRSLAFGRTLETMDVVLIQDNRGAQAILRSMIAAFRVKRLRVYDRADDALKEMMADPPTVVVTEWDMRPMSGYRFARLVRDKALDPLCYVPIIVIAGNATMSVIDRALAVGVNTVLVKPVAPAVLRQRLEWLTADHRGYVLKGDSVAIDGMEEILDTRVRRNGVADLIRRQRAMQDALDREAEDVQEVAPRPVDGGVAAGLDAEKTAPKPPERPARPRKPAGSGKPETWNSWTMN